MWGKADELRLSVLMGLRKGLSLIRGMRRSLTDDEQHKVAEAIVEHLESHNWKIEPGPPREGHGPHLMSKDPTIDRTADGVQSIRRRR
jgi:hypothetical protein